MKMTLKTKNKVSHCLVESGEKYTFHYFFSAGLSFRDTDSETVCLIFMQASHPHS